MLKFKRTWLLFAYMNSLYNISWSSPDLVSWREEFESPLRMPRNSILIVINHPTISH